MTDKIEQLINELISAMPELKGREDVLRPLLNELLAARPDAGLDPVFRSELKKRLLAHGVVKTTAARRLWRVYAPLAGAVALATLILVLQSKPKAHDIALAPSSAQFDAVPAQEQQSPPQTMMAAGSQPRAMSAVSNKSTSNMKITSSAFKDGEMIPAEFTCDGAKVSPPLSFADLPDGTQSLALIVEDPDAPRGTFTHWVVWNIPAGVMGLERISEGGQLPIGIVNGTNSAGTIGYVSPCPPSGTHHYVFILYALDTMLDLSSSADSGALYQAIAGHILEETSLTGLYGRQ